MLILLKCHIHGHVFHTWGIHIICLWFMEVQALYLRKSNAMSLCMAMSINSLNQGMFLKNTLAKKATIPCYCLGHSQNVESSATVVSRWLWPGNRTFLEVASIVVSWWIVAFLRYHVFKAYFFMSMVNFCFVSVVRLSLVLWFLNVIYSCLLVFHLRYNLYLTDYIQEVHI